MLSEQMYRLRILHPKNFDFEIEPNNCFENVKKAVEQYGGTPIPGWMVGEKTPLTEHLVHHCIWEKEGVLFDITPQWVAIKESWAAILQVREFYMDDEAVWNGDSLPSRWRAMMTYPELKQACEYLNQSEIATHNGDYENCRLWTDKANVILRRHGVIAGDPARDQIVCEVRRNMLAKKEAK